jgi:hypothetical protein
MNLGAYTEALTGAEQWSSTLGQAYVVVYYSLQDSFIYINLETFTNLATPDDYGRIVASVDHQGIITESNWVKEQLGLKEVAA